MTEPETPAGAHQGYPGIMWWARAIPTPLRRAVPFRLKKAILLASYFRRSLANPAAAKHYLLRDAETTNFTYEIDNRDELVAFLASALRINPEAIDGYVTELEEDGELRSELRVGLRARRDRNPEPRYGRRLGWYAAVRAMKPRLVVETGVHDGLGSAVLRSALARNGHEGAAGRHLGIDPDPLAGWLIPTRLLPVGDIVNEPSLAVLEGLGDNGPVDLFLHDSDHRYEYELAEYRAVQHALSENALLLSDNAHYCDALVHHSQQNGRKFFFWKEISKNHFYPGDGLGISI